MSRYSPTGYSPAMWSDFTTTKQLTCDYTNKYSSWEFFGRRVWISIVIFPRVRFCGYEGWSISYLLNRFASNTGACHYVAVNFQTIGVIKSKSCQQLSKTRAKYQNLSWNKICAFYRALSCVGQKYVVLSEILIFKEIKVLIYMTKF